MNPSLQPYLIEREPYYRAAGNEVALFAAAFARGLPMMLKGPTGCGKTRFIEHMAWRLKRPLITLACNEDMAASDLVGRYLLDVQGTVWHDGPLTTAVRHGAICYLDEVVEARQDTTVVIHPLTDERRMLPLDKRGELVKAHPAGLRHPAGAIQGRAQHQGPRQAYRLPGRVHAHGLGCGRALEARREARVQGGFYQPRYAQGSAAGRAGAWCSWRRKASA